MAAQQNQDKQEILTFTQIGRAVAKGVLIGDKFNNPLIGAVLSVSLEASKCAGHITERLMKELSTDASEVEVADTTNDEDQDSVKSKPLKLRN